MKCDLLPRFAYWYAFPKMHKIFGLQKIGWKNYTETECPQLMIVCLVTFQNYKGAEWSNLHFLAKLWPLQHSRSQNLGPWQSSSLYEWLQGCCSSPGTYSPPNLHHWVSAGLGPASTLLDPTPISTHTPSPIGHLLFAVLWISWKQLLCHTTFLHSGGYMTSTWKQAPFWSRLNSLRQLPKWYTLLEQSHMASKEAEMQSSLLCFPNTLSGG